MSEEMNIMEGGVDFDPYNQQTSEESQTGQTDQAANRAEALERELAEAVEGYDGQLKTYEDMIREVGYTPESEEDRRKRERRERSKRIIGAVSDGLSALSNLYFTSQYAPTSQTGRTMSEAIDNRIEKLRAEREKKRDQHFNLALKMGDVKNQRARTVRELEAQQEARRIAREKAEREAELHPLNKAIKVAQGRKEDSLADKAGYEAETSRIGSLYAPQINQGKVALNRAKVATEFAKQGTEAARTNKLSKEADVERPSALDRDGNVHYFATSEEADNFAKANGTWVTTRDVKVEEKSGKDGSRTTSSTTKTYTSSGHRRMSNSSGKGKGYGDFSKWYEGKGKGY